MKKVYKGQPLLARDFNDLVDAVRRAINIRGVGGIFVQRTTGGILIRGQRKGAGGSATSSRHPFQVYADGSDSDGNPQVTVAIDSWLMLSQRPSDKMTVSGLGEPFAIEAGQKIWLEVEFDETEGPTTATIKHGDPWLNYDKPVFFNTDTGAGDGDNKRQTRAYLLIAEAIEMPDPNPYADRLTLTVEGETQSTSIQIVQCVHTNVRLCRDCFEGDTCQLFTPYFGAGSAAA